MTTRYVGGLEIQGEVIGTTSHGGRGVGWEFEPIWKPGDGQDKLVEVLERFIAFGEQKRSKEIGKMLGIGQ